MPHKPLLYETKADKLCQQLHGSMAGQAPQPRKAIECKGLLGIGQEAQQGLLTLGEGKHSSSIPTLLAPKGHLHWRSHNILVVNAHESAKTIIIQAGTHRAFC